MMVENQNRSQLRKFYNTLEDQPLEPSNPYYYPFLQENDSDPIAELANRISFSVSESVNLFSGQTGCGKSTEFRRLEKTLKDDDCEVFLLDMREYMNLTTAVEISDFLISMMTALSDEVEQRYGKAPAKRGYLERLSDFLNTEVNLDNMGFKTGFGDIKASLKDDPTFKQRLQESLQGHTAKIVSAAHSFAQDTVTLIRDELKDTDKKIVLLIDSVEQIKGVGADGSEKVHKSVANLFSGHAPSLQIPMLHIVYTIPPYLTALVPGLGRQLGGAMACTLPSIHVQNKDNSKDHNGLEIMRELITRRYSQWEQLFSPEQLNTLAEASGGDLRDFFRLIRAALVKTVKTIPVQDKVIEQAQNHLRREMMPLANDDKQWLREITENKKANLAAIEKLPDLARFFDTKLVLNYRNGDDWYDVHPLLKKEINE
jgi:energy-coupling factor transporter ATP-binding protein EcfA2